MGKTQFRPAIVLGLSANGLAVVRSLGRKGIPVVGVDVDARGPARFSRYLQSFKIAPPLSDEDAFIGFMISLCNELADRAVIYPTGDEYVAFLSNFREDLAPYFDFLLPGEVTVDTFLDKKQTAEFAKVRNIPHPRTFVLSRPDDVVKVKDLISYPCVLKPHVSHHWRNWYRERKVMKVNTPQEFEACFAECHRASLDVIAQEIISGPDSNIYQFIALCGRDSEPLAMFCCHKLRQYPPHFGIACLCESNLEPKIIESGREFLKKLPYQGIIAIEFKFDAERRTPYFLEANLRTSFFGELPIAAGMDFPYIMYRYLVYNDNTRYETRFQDNVKLMNLELDLGCLSRLREKHEITVKEWLKGFRAQKLAHTYWAWDDLKPWGVVYARFTGRLLKKVWQKAFAWRPDLSGVTRLMTKIRKQLPPPRRSETRTAATTTPAVPKPVHQKRFSVPKWTPRKDKPSQSLVKPGPRPLGPLKVLHLISSQGLFGAEQVVLSLAQSSQAHGLPVVVGCLEDQRSAHTELVDLARAQGLTTVRFPCRGRLDSGTLRAIKKYIKEQQITVLHTHNYKSDFYGVLAAKSAKVPIVATAHGFTDMDHKVGFYERLDRWLLRHFFDRVVVVSRKMLPDLAEDKKRLVPNGMSPDKFKVDRSQGKSFRSNWRLDDQDFVVGTVGRLSREKNQVMLIQAVYPLLRKFPRLKVLIVGEGPLHHDLFRFVEERHLNHQVIFTGLVHNVVPVYQALDLFVLCSLTEGVPLTILEAMAAKVPVIATRVGGIPEILADGRTGVLIDVNDVESLKTEISRLMKDRHQRLELANAAFTYVQEEFSLEKMFQGYQRVYQELEAGVLPGPIGP